MPTVCGVNLIKRFPYRGDANEEFSNFYWLTGSIPSDATAWKALADALIAQEKTVYPAAVSVIRAYGYNDTEGRRGIDDEDTAPAVWSYDYLLASSSVAGTYGGAFVTVPGDVAYFAKWKTSRLNSKGKPVYLRKYFHGGGASSGNQDLVAPTLVTAVTALTTKLRDGSFLDGRLVRSANNAETFITSGCGPYLTTRTLKRRGKRPGS